MAWPTVVAGCATEKDYSMTTKKPAPLPISELTLRDYFAAEVIGLLFIESANSLEDDAAAAYRLADVMLAARLK